MAANAAAANKHKIKSDEELRQMLEDHRVIIDQFLPLPPKEEAPPKAQPGKFVMLSLLLQKVRSNGYFVTGDTTDRKVTVPKHFSDDLTTAECQELLNKEGIKYAEFANH